MDVSKGIIYYSDNRLEEPIFSIVQKQILKSYLPIVSVTLKPIDFGKNIVLPLKPNYLTMVKQIIMALKNSSEDVIFFCEHDVLYPESHFDFVPPKDDIFYYNSNIWRWDYPSDRAITYERLISLSSLCVNRLFALNHYTERLSYIYLNDWQDDIHHEPEWARKWGYEPGTKKKKRGGFSDHDFDTWRSDDPVIDIRHSHTFSMPKVTLGSFKHAPLNWQEIKIEYIQGWNLKSMFNL